MRDETTNEKIKVQKMVYKVARRELHNELISPVEEGGFAGARNEKGEVLISLTSFERYFPNWVVKMNEWYKQMCCCHLCNEPEHMHRSIRLVRLRLLRLLENQTWGEDDPRYVRPEIVEQYKRELLVNGTLPVAKDELKDDCVSKAVDRMTCSRKEVNGKKFYRFECVVGDCPDCKDKYKPPTFEETCGEAIKFEKYYSLPECTWHGDGSIEPKINDKGKQAGTQCSLCMKMTPEEYAKMKANKKGKDPKITRKKNRVKHVDTVKNYVKFGGELHQKMIDLRFHSFHRKWLGSNHAMSMAKEFVNKNPGKVISVMSDHSLDFSPRIDGQYQSEYFGDHPSIQMEGHAVELALPSNGESALARAVQERRRPATDNTVEATTSTDTRESQDSGNSDDDGVIDGECQSGHFGSQQIQWNYVQLFYSVLSDEKRKDAQTTAYNLKMLIVDLVGKGDMNFATFKIVVSIVDGCAVQYRSGSVCCMLCSLAESLGITIDRIVNAPGHGKCIVDAMNGVDKTLLNLFFSCLVAHPEELKKDMKGVHTHNKVDGDEKLSLASVCLGILDDKDRKFGVKSHKNRSKHRKVEEKRYFERMVGAAAGCGAKFKAIGFRKETKCSLGFMYNLRADPELIVIHKKNGKTSFVIAIRRFPCYCDGCRKKLEEPIETRYVGKCDTCDYWAVFRKRDGQSGYNDWMIIELVPDHKKGFDEDDFQEMNKFNLNTFGYRMSRSIEDGRFGAYNVDAEDYDYYIVRWEGEPFKAKQTEVIKIDGEEFAVTEGEWLCYGRWLTMVPNTTKWWYQTEQRCVVRLQVVTDPDVDLQRMSPTNKIHSSAGRDTIAFANQQDSCWRISQEDHDFLLEEATNRAVYDFEYEAPEEDAANQDLGDEEEEEPHPDDEDSSVDESTSVDESDGSAETDVED